MLVEAKDTVTWGIIEGKDDKEQDCGSLWDRVGGAVQWRKNWGGRGGRVFSAIRCYHCGDQEWLASCWPFLFHSSIEIKFIQPLIHPFQVYSSAFFGVFIE